MVRLLIIHPPAALLVLLLTSSPLLADTVEVLELGARLPRPPPRRTRAGARIGRGWPTRPHLRRGARR
jgi:hypothetical protein